MGGGGAGVAPSFGQQQIGFEISRVLGFICFNLGTIPEHDGSVSGIHESILIIAVVTEPHGPVKYHNPPYRTVIDPCFGTR